MWSIGADSDARFVADSIRRYPREDGEHSLSPCPTTVTSILPRSAARRVIPGRPGRSRRTRLVVGRRAGHDCPARLRCSGR